MSIVLLGGMFTPTCDICGEELPALVDFKDAVKERRAEGWQIRKDKHGDWEDICEECQETEVAND
jgi:hypothetical protein